MTIAYSVIFGIIIAIVVYQIYPYNVTILGGPCPFKETTGLDCLFCGGTRSLRKILDLHFIEAFRYNTAIITGLIASLLYVLFNDRKCLDKNKSFTMRYSLAVIIVYLLACHCIMKDSDLAHVGVIAAIGILTQSMILLYAICYSSGSYLNLIHGIITALDMAVLIPLFKAAEQQGLTYIVDVLIFLCFLLSMTIIRVVVRFLYYRRGYHGRNRS